MHRHLRRTVALVGVATVATLGFGSLGAGALTSTVDIRVEHNLDPLDGDLPRVLERLGVTPGPGFEVTIADEISNPDGWGGNVMIDIDPDAQQIIVEVEDDNCYNTVLVEITTDEIDAVSVISDGLFSDEGVTLSTSVTGGVVTLSWAADFCADFDVEGSQAVFSYTLGDTTPPSTEDTTPPLTEDTTPPSTEETSTTTAAAAQPTVVTPRFTG